MSTTTIGQNARVQTLAKVVDSFVDSCLWQLASHPRYAAFIMSTNMLVIIIRLLLLFIIIIYWKKQVTNVNA